MSSKTIVIAEILTDAFCPFGDIHLWRSDFLQFLGLKNMLYHNHDPQTGKTINQYPLIQYRSYEDKAGIFGIEEGAKILDQDIAGGMSAFISRTDGKLTNITKMMYPFYLSNGQKLYDYELVNYAPFHSEAYKDWKTMGLANQVLDLEKRIRGSLLLQFCRALQWRLDEPLTVEILSKENSYKLERVDKADLFYMTHNLVFRANMHLPERMAIGNNVAYGYGLIYLV